MSDQNINRLDDLIKNLGDIKPPSPKIPIMNPAKEVVATVPFNQLINPEENIFNVFQENKLAPSHLEIAGGHQSDLGFLNIDPLAKQGLKMTLQNIPAVIQKGSVQVIFLFNPYFEKNSIGDLGQLMKHIFDYCLAKDGVGLVGGNLSNSYFKKIWGSGLQNFESLDLTLNNRSPDEEEQLQQSLNRFYPPLYDHLVKGEFYQTSFYTGNKSKVEAKTTINRLKLFFRQFLICLIIINCY